MDSLVLKRRPILIAIDGLDGCGKTTTIERLHNLLKESDRPVTSVAIHEPGGTPVGESLRKVLKNHAGGNLCPVTELLIVLASRNELYRQIEQSKPEVDVIFFDRGLWSTFMYQAVLRHNKWPLTQASLGQHQYESEVLAFMQTTMSGSELANSIDAMVHSQVKTALDDLARMVNGTAVIDLPIDTFIIDTPLEVRKERVKKRDVVDALDNRSLSQFASDYVFPLTQYLKAMYEDRFEIVSEDEAITKIYSYIMQKLAEPHFV